MCIRDRQIDQPERLFTTSVLVTSLSHRKPQIPAINDAVSYTHLDVYKRQVLTPGPGSQAEIQIGSMTVRLDSDTTLDFSRIDDEQVRLYLSGGRAIAKLPSRDVAREFELNTPNGRFNANDAGIYRFDADANSSSAVSYTHLVVYKRQAPIDAAETLPYSVVNSLACSPTC